MNDREMAEKAVDALAKGHYYGEFTNIFTSIVAL